MFLRNIIDSICSLNQKLHFVESVMQDCLTVKRTKGVAMSAYTHAFQWSISFIQDLQFDFYHKQIHSKLV